MLELPKETNKMGRREYNLILGADCISYLMILQTQTLGIFLASKITLDFSRLPPKRKRRKNNKHLRIWKEHGELKHDQ